MRPSTIRHALAALLLLAATAFADKAPVADQAMIEAAQEGITNPAKRSKAIKKSAAAAKADATVQAIGGPEAAQDIYQLAADVVSDLMKQTGGDPDKMQAILEQAQKDPEGFAKRFPASRRASLKKIADKVEAQKAKEMNP